MGEHLARNHTYFLIGCKKYLSLQMQRYKRTSTILLFYFQGLKIYLFALLFFSILLGIMETFQIVLLYPILDASFNLDNTAIPFLEPLYAFLGNSIDLPQIITFCLIFMAFVVFTFLVTVTYKIISLKFTKAIIVRTKGLIFDKIQYNDYRYFVENKQGDILYNVVTSPGKINIFMDRSTRIFADIVVILIILLTLLFVSPIATILLLIGGVGFILIVRFIGNRVSYFIGKVQLQSISSENAIITQYIQGLRQIRSVHADNYWKYQYELALNNYWDKYVRSRFTETLPAALLQMGFFIGIAAVVIILFNVQQDNFINLIPLIATFAFSALKIMPRLTEIGHNNMQMMDSYADMERIYLFLNDSRYRTIKNGTIVFHSLKDDIVFENVNYRYDENQALINNLNLTIHKNRVTALVGHSGAGKSTVISLLLRYYDVTNGRILLNGIDIREYNISSFLEKIGYVSQDTFIYNASIRENIVFGGEYSEKQVVLAAERANIHKFIVQLPNTYDTVVGDQGLKLSGGEKQRIAIARALVREPEILILDEATSNLDNESEAIVQESINKISETVTTFIVAHRLSTIREADKIYVMNAGKIIEGGNHNDLIEMGGVYYNLYKKGS